MTRRACFGCAGPFNLIGPFPPQLCHFLESEAMILSANHLAIHIVSSVFAMGLLTPFADAQMGRNMPSGMMGMPSMGRSTFMGGVGMNPNIRMMMMSMGRTSMSPYGMSSASQGGNTGMSSGGGYGSQYR